MKSHGTFSRANLLVPLDPKRGDLALLACCFVTGMLDCAVFNNYGVFVGMQTGICDDLEAIDQPQEA